ncbi:hypothetical protein K437DRAFT_226755 [Tilletiaria anomala UBC 951]|uniref:Peptidase M48 domain-containing protein n=1 Tax=Tilletiaria anomala (strain ATCC 24038 / CBS 436.72 / UBC 951) TaxID=1037660 RepID=A0A066VME3_TILAU|nr:uncharacterized protein K437DRAFT_226755 [Tilletiaria anomala UBC 951]KDN41443.1 hypothetical protein K437DRAFT_226755 [Tilletiaria anomala UBC 951]
MRQTLGQYSESLTSVRLLQRRTFSSQFRRSASYKRFGQGRSIPSGFPGIPGQSPRSSFGASLNGVPTRLGGGGSGQGPFGRIPPVIFIIIGLGGGYYVMHLERVPQTGRLRFNDVSPTQEEQMGIESYKEMLRKYRGRILSPSHPYSQMVKRVAERIVRAIESTGMAEQGLSSVGGDGEVRMGDAHKDDEFLRSKPLGVLGRRKSGSDPDASSKTDWEVFVIHDDSEKNAFVLPGGKIFVFTGILPICKDEDGLATVLGHEIAHQLARHGAEKMAGFKVLIAGAAILELLGLDIGLSRAALTLLLQLPNSRKTEIEADYIGLRLMSQACFDPRQAQHLWRRMQASEGTQTGGIGEVLEGMLSTHPVTRSRIENMQKWLPEAEQIRDASGCPAEGAMNAFRAAPESPGGRFGQRPSGAGYATRQPETDPYGLTVLRG